MAELRTAVRVFIEYEHQDKGLSSNNCSIVSWFVSIGSERSGEPLEELDRYCLKCATPGKVVRLCYASAKDCPWHWCTVLPSAIDPSCILPGYPALLTSHGYEITS